MAEPIEFFFDFSSPYAYLASRKIDALAAKHGREVEWKPILLGAIFKLTGMAPLTSIPMKGDYMRHDFPRMARLFDVPVTFPSPFPFSSIHAVRAVYWLKDVDPKAANALSRNLINAAFNGRDITAAQSVADIAAEQGLDPAALLAAIETQEVKDKTKAANEAAIARGVFGAPFIVVDGEPFWGADRLDQVDRWLETGGW